MLIEGFAKTGTRTKDLIKYLSVNDIAVIQHDDIDELAAEALIAAGVRAVINTGKSMTGRYASKGASLLSNSEIFLFDTSLSIGTIKDGDYIKLRGKDLILNNEQLFSNSCVQVNKEYIKLKLAESSHLQVEVLSNFIENTIQHVALDKASILNFNDYPDLSTVLSGRIAIVVVRDIESYDCLLSLKSFIDIERPVLIGVDGGADVIISCGFTPDILIGDMDSVSDVGIFRSKDLVLHAYSDGSCPCIEKIKALNIKYKLLAMPGTSEDIALLLAYDKGASSIVLIGGHNCMSDFLDRGRLGMGSTLITRLKVEERLIDFRHFTKLQQLIDRKTSDTYSNAEGDLVCVKM